MATFGCFLSSEEHGPKEPVRQARLAERAGFEAPWISDHFHPWPDMQGDSPFVRSVIGAPAEATSLPIMTAVTCPPVRVRPAITAQAIGEYLDAGCTEVYVNQIGEEQDAFFDFYAKEVLPQVR